jgi:murein DD-endopeptidase MepM/ murein hydrolase activator NlpD
MKVVPVAPVLLILGLIGAEFAYIRQVYPAEMPENGLPSDTFVDNAIQLDGTALIGNTSPVGELEVSSTDEDFAGFVLVEQGSLLNVTSPVSNTDKLRGGLLSYSIEEGDSLSTIAAEFGISVNTIIWANNINNSGLIKPGQEIVILPVSGVLHEAKEGESIDTIAALYGIPVDKLISFNDEKIKSGETVIVPNAKPIEAIGSGISISQSNLPDANGYFIRPVDGGWNWGRLHETGAIDIADACGTPILAAADGLVVSVGNPISWNSGYGGFIKIEHPNGTKTLYAHNSQNLVSVGDSIFQGEQIAKIGNTGRTQGVTGCHVHFGITGAKNPFVK